MTVRYRIEVDREQCAGTGMCAAIAEGFFEIDDEYRSRPVLAIVEADEAALEPVLEAAECCPMGAITVIDDNTDEQLSPAVD